MISEESNIERRITLYSKQTPNKETREYLINKLKEVRKKVRKQKKFNKKNNWIEFYKEKGKTK